MICLFYSGVSAEDQGKASEVFTLLPHAGEVDGWVPEGEPEYAAGEDLLYLINGGAYVPPWYHLAGGGMLLCAFFIATDPVTAPLTRRGMWIFGIGVGSITMLIRIVGEYPEGVMFSVLIMNAVTPLIDRLCKRIPAGGKPATT